MRNVGCCIRSLFLGCAAILLTACGGGSGGDGGSTTVYYTVSTSVGTGGSISPTSAQVESGQSASFEISIDDNYSISSASGCSGSLSGTTYTTGTVTSDCTVTVNIQAPVQGVFVDSPVSGLSYTAGSISGITDSSGGFICQPDTEITFSIGNLALGGATCAEVLSPIDLVGDSGSINDAVVAQAIFLQVFDADSDSTNGIELTESLSQALESVSIDWTADIDSIFSADAIQQLLVEHTGSTFTPSSCNAKKHLVMSLQDLGLLQEEPVPVCTAPQVGIKAVSGFDVTAAEGSDYETVEFEVITENFDLGVQGLVNVYWNDVLIKQLDSSEASLRLPLGVHEVKLDLIAANGSSAGATPLTQVITVNDTGTFELVAEEGVFAYSQLDVARFEVRGYNMLPADLEGATLAGESIELDYVDARNLFVPINVDTSGDYVLELPNLNGGTSVTLSVPQIAEKLTLAEAQAQSQQLITFVDGLLQDVPSGSEQEQELLELKTELTNFLGATDITDEELAAVSVILELAVREGVTTRNGDVAWGSAILGALKLIAVLALGFSLAGAAAATGVGALAAGAALIVSVAFIVGSVESVKRDHGYAMEQAIQVGISALRKVTGNSTSSSASFTFDNRSPYTMRRTEEKEAANGYYEYLVALKAVQVQAQKLPSWIRSTVGMDNDFFNPSLIREADPRDYSVSAVSSVSDDDLACSSSGDRLGELVIECTGSVDQEFELTLTNTVQDFSQSFTSYLEVDEPTAYNYEFNIPSNETIEEEFSDDYPQAGISFEILNEGDLKGSATFDGSILTYSSSGMEEGDVDTISYRVKVDGVYSAEAEIRIGIDNSTYIQLNYEVALDQTLELTSEHFPENYYAQPISFELNGVEAGGSGAWHYGSPVTFTPADTLVVGDVLSAYINVKYPDGVFDDLYEARIEIVEDRFAFLPLQFTFVHPLTDRLTTTISFYDMADLPDDGKSHMIRVTLTGVRESCIQYVDKSSVTSVDDLRNMNFSCALRTYESRQVDVKPQRSVCSRWMEHRWSGGVNSNMTYGNWTVYTEEEGSTDPCLREDEAPVYVTYELKE